MIQHEIAPSVQLLKAAIHRDTHLVLFDFGTTDVYKLGIIFPF